MIQNDDYPFARPVSATMEEPEFYVTEEGGLYRKWEPRIRGISVFALFFPSGKVWDAYLGWRELPIQEVRDAYERAQQTVRDKDV